MSSSCCVLPSRWIFLRYAGAVAIGLAPDLYSRPPMSSSMTRSNASVRRASVSPALAGALVFGCASTLVKQLLGTTDPWLLAGRLYLGAGIGLTIYRRLVSA